MCKKYCEAEQYPIPVQVALARVIEDDLMKRVTILS